jgi:hypothetical protein
VDMHVPQTGDQKFTSRLDNASIFRNSSGSGGSNGCDAITADYKSAVSLRRMTGAVNQSRIANGHDGSAGQ